MRTMIITPQHFYYCHSYVYIKVLYLTLWFISFTKNIRTRQTCQCQITAPSNCSSTKVLFSIMHQSIFSIWLTWLTLDCPTAKELLGKPSCTGFIPLASQRVWFSLGPCFGPLRPVGGVQARTLCVNSSEGWVVDACTWWLSEVVSLFSRKARSGC